LNLNALTAFDWLRHRARLRLWDHDRAWGRRGEDVAHRYLRARGYTIVARNYRTRSGSGEVDLIGWDGETLAFVEVKARQTEEFGTPDWAVDPEKQRRLLIAARDYVRHAGVEWEKARFDIVSVVWSKADGVTLIKDAFAKSAAAARGGH
jgi:putative endonuclease